jgi:hypothetical protein
VAWDYSEWLDGYPGQWISLIRRHGQSWFWAAISAEATPRSISQRLSFLSEDVSYRAHGYQDDLDGGGLAVTTAVVDASQALDMTVAARGGSWVWFEPLNVR